MNHIIITALHVLGLAAILLVLRKLAPRIERLSAGLGLEDPYHRVAAVLPILIMIGIMYSISSALLALVLKMIIK